MKGISPLVASVLLIAITMTIAGMLAWWASSFVKERTAAWENQTAGGECDLADFEVYRCSYDPDNQKINMMLNNRRNIELMNLIVYVIYQNTSTFEYPLNESLSPLALKSYSVSPVSSDYSTIMVKTHCPNVYASSRC